MPYRYINLLFACFLFMTAGLVHATQGLPDFTSLVKENADAVVNISTTKQQDVQELLPPGLDNPDIPRDGPLGDFLEKFFGGQPGIPEHINPQSLGSGFIISRDGYVVTNHHVVSDADEIVVKLSDRRELVAELIGTDQRSDIALLKIDADNLPVVDMGSSDDIEVGQWVLAIGSPFGFDHSVTAGIVSAKGRSLPNENYVPFIQTDVAINPGNSGGPLFDLDGKVVGINSQIYSRTGGFMGLSFAIPIEVAMDVVEQLKTTGSVSRGWLGVFIQEVTRELAESFGMKKPSGALVSKILPDSPAEKADIEVGDIILSFNGVDIPNSAALPPVVGSTRVGQSVPLKIMRNGKEKRITLEIGKLPDQENLVAGRAQEQQQELILGMQLRELTQDELEQRKLESGLLVTRVETGAARTAGIREGDIVQMINGESVNDVQQLGEVISGLPKGKFASVLVQRPRGPQFLALKIPD